MNTGDLAEGNMVEFQNPFFTSTSAEVEAEYVAGVDALQADDYNAASRHFGNAARDSICLSSGAEDA